MLRIRILKILWSAWRGIDSWRGTSVCLGEGVCRRRINYFIYKSFITISTGHIPHYNRRDKNEKDSIRNQEAACGFPLGLAASVPLTATRNPSTRGTRVRIKGDRVFDPVTRNQEAATRLSIRHNRATRDYS